MHVTLTVTQGPHAGQEFRFDRHDTFLVGRSKLAHFRLPKKDKFFSRLHFLVEINPPRCQLRDMLSHNGTFLNGEKVLQPAELKDGDQIRAGKTTLRVSVHPDEAGRPQEPPEAVPAADPGAWEPAPPAAGRPPGPAGDRCRGCAGPAPAGVAPAPKGLIPAGLGPLCAGCQREIQGQAQLLAPYVLVRQLGAGEMGVVYLALRKADGVPVALKTIPLAGDVEPVDLRRFLREAAILRSLDHPNIVHFRAMSASGCLAYFETDFVRGTDAARLLQSHGPLPVGRAADLTCQALEALEYAHAKKYVHRDVKPANLLLTEEGGREVVKLADFGLARVYQSSKVCGLTLTDDLGGSIAYMAPEQITHFSNAQPPTDQYAAAATLYKLLTNHTAHDLPRGVEGQLRMVLEQDPVPIQARRPDVPDGLAALVHRALARKPQERFRDVAAMRQALAAFRR